MDVIGDLAQHAPLPLVSIGLWIVLIGARELGVVANGARRRERAPKAANGDEGYILTAVLGLLALLIAFTFSLALSRYDQRRELVVAEANALGTAWLRTSNLDSPEALRAAMRDYARARLALGLSIGESQAEAGERVDASRARMWSAAIEAVRPQRTTAVTNLVLAPINDAIDLAAERKAALSARLPSRVVATLALYAIASAAVLGYATAEAAARQRFVSACLFALVVLAIALILDLDRPNAGFITVSQQPMADTVRDMGR